jgi:hypothetical protein
MAGALALLLGSCAATTHPDTDEWHALFDVVGASWSYVGDATWSFSDGELIAANATTNSFIVTNKTYSDFRLQAEFYPVDETNSGIYFRCDPDRLTATDCYEANIADNHQNEQSRTGSLVGHSEPNIRSETINKWNTYEIVALGARIQIWTNGVQTAEFASATIPNGVIALQLFKTGEVRFRNIRIQEL